jgi:hypothetical protein
MNKTMRRILVHLALVTLGFSPKAQATSFILADFAYKVNNSSSTRVHTSTLGEIQFGFFAAGFTPTLANFSQWQTNFTGETGYYDGKSNSIEWSAGINIGSNDLYPVGTQLVAIVYDLADNANLLNATQAAILTNPAWVISASTGSDPSQFYYDFTGKYAPTVVSGVTSALFGTLDTTSSVVTMSAVPEPAAGFLLLLSGLGLVALRRLRKV